jgi:hypothetical protein
MGQNSILLCGSFSFWGGFHTQILLHRRLTILGAHWGFFVFSGPKLKFTLGHYTFLWNLRNSNFSLGFCTFSGRTGTFWFSGAKNQILFRGLLSIVSVPNSNLTLGALTHSLVPDKGSTVDDREQVGHAEPRIGGH